MATMAMANPAMAGRLQGKVGFVHRLFHAHQTAHVNYSEEAGDESDKGEERILPEGEFGRGRQILKAIKETAVMNCDCIPCDGSDGDGCKGAERVMADDGFMGKDDRRDRRVE